MPSKIRDIADILGVTEAANPTNAVLTSVADGSGLVVYATLDDLPTSGLTAGDQAYVTSTNRLYVSNGSGWYNVALFNATPTLSISPSGAVTLAVDGVTPTIITLTGVDSDNADANLLYSVESDGSFADIATLSQDSSVFTITPLSEGAATPGSSTLTFKVSDGISFGSGTTTFSLTFGPDWSVSPTESKIQSSDIAGDDRFGRGVEINSDGTYAIVGAYLNDHAAAGGNGAAYIFTRSGSTWTQQAKLVASDADTQDQFGFNVDISSDGAYAIAGAHNDDDGAASAGSAYIFSRSGSTWSQQAKLTASNAAFEDFFGIDVSINSDGTYAIVGAYSLATTGKAYVFTRSGSTWTEQEELLASDGAQYDRFGNSVKINSDATYAIVGAYHERGGSINVNECGTAYVFTRSGSTWTEQAILRPSDHEGYDQFGYSVSMSGDGSYAIVGAPFEDTNGTSAGSVYIFSRSGSTWTQQQKIQSSDIEADDTFGAKVALSSNGNYAIVGAPTEDTGGVNAGAVYIFERSGSTWTQVKKLQASDIQADDRFGESVAMNSDGTYVIIGAFLEDTGGSKAGSAYIYEAG